MIPSAIFVSPLIRLSVFPLGQDYHLPHHVFPLVPHFNLRKLHELLLQADAYRDEAVIVKGYFIPAERPPQHPTVVDLLSEPVAQAKDEPAFAGAAGSGKNPA